MRLIARLHRGLVDLLAGLAGLILVWMMLAVVASVMLRNAGAQPPAWLFTSTEYGMLYLTMLGAPWLVRERGHVHIELLIAALPPRAMAVASRAVALACVLICAVLAWKGLELVQTNIARRDLDVRAYFTPKWWLTAAFPLAFALMAVEFARFVAGPRLMHDGAFGVRE